MSCKGNGGFERPRGRVRSGGGRIDERRKIILSDH